MGSSATLAAGRFDPAKIGAGLLLMRAAQSFRKNLILNG